MMQQLQTFWAIVRKDVAIWVRSPATIAVTILPALILMLVLILQAAAVTGSPVAIVNQDPRGPAAIKLQHIAQNFSGFYRAQMLSEAKAEKEYNQLAVAGVLTIPADFSAKLAAGEHPVVTWQIRNFNNDTANDLRRALPDIMTTFLKSGAAGPDDMRIQVRETDLHAKDVSFVAFNMVAVVVMLILQAGVVNAGLAAVREWETGSVKELLMSPARPLTMVLGKVGAGVVASDITGAVALTAAVSAGVLQPPSVGLGLLAVLCMTITALIGSGIGVLLGALLRSTERVSGLSISLSFYLFFLAGGITDIAYLPGWLQAVANFVPNTYSLDLLRQTLLYQSTSGVGYDFVILAFAALIALVVGVPVIRRGLSH